MLHIGYHESTSGGFAAMGEEAVSVGADTFAFFTRNPRGGTAKPVDAADAAKLCAFMKEHHFAPLVAHSPYTMNPCSSNPDLRKFALDMMIDDFARLQHIPGCLYNFHPGSHTGQGTKTGIALTAGVIAAALKQIDRTCAETGTPCSTILLVETMAGKGSEIGKTFEEVRAILDLAEQNYGASLSARTGVCLDTCHIWDGGYDIVHDLDGTVSSFDNTVGLDRLRAVHLNDSLNVLGAHKDRHAKIGEGEIGLEALARVINHPAFKNIPFILETPNEHDGYKKEIALLKSKYAG
jgi:apurinic endonuclease (APN1)